MNLDPKKLLARAKDFLNKFKKYSGFAFIVTVLLIYSFLVLRIGILSQAEPSEDAIAEQQNTIKRLKIDQNSIDKINELEDQNIGVQSLFEAARDNPFQD